ncbi:TPA: hypothetical protein DCE37_05720 [Candidatus Latescibacteria bacterium]|nr:hypothetical protein [Candidatus Latescibacterota bacterium]
MAVKGSKRILALKKRKAREQEGAFLIEGIRLCEEALKVDGATEQLIFARDMLDRNERLATLHQTAEADADVMVQMTDRRAMKGMCDTETPQGVVGVAREPEWDREEVIQSGKPLLILDQVRDPGNLGMIVRTAEATGAGGIFLLKGSVELLNAKVVRSTMGSVFRLPVLIDQRPGSLCDDLKRAGVHIFATDVDGRLFTEVDYSKPHAFLLGNEAFGIDPEVVKLADQTVGIPMAEPVNSLNVGVAAGVLLYQGMGSRQ